MPLRNGEAGYGTVSKVLHWLTVLVLLAQFTGGYLLSSSDSSGHGRGRGRGHGPGHGRGRGGDDLSFDDPLLRVHVVLGLSTLVLAVARVLWRRAGLPPWTPTLSAGERTLATWTERTLLATLFAIPLTGLAMLLGDDDLLPWHVATHGVFFVALAVHVGLVLKHTLVDRDRLLSRML